MVDNNNARSGGLRIGGESMSVRTYMVQYVGRSLTLPRFERQVDVIYEHGTGREYWLAETAEMQQTGYATATCSRCGVEFQGEHLLQRAARLRGAARTLPAMRREVQDVR